MDVPSQKSSTLTPTGRRTVFINSIFLILAVLWVVLIWVTLDPYVDDFKQYWQAAINIHTSGDPYATTPEPGQTSRSSEPAYPNPPLLAYIIYPLGFIEYPIARGIWFLFNCLLLAGILAISIFASGSSYARQYWGVVIFLAVISPPTRLSLQLGQISILLTLLIYISGSLTEHIFKIRSTYQNAFASILISLATFIKLFPGLIFVYYWLSKRHLAWWCVIVCMILGLLSIITIGIAPHETYIHKVLLGGYYPYEAEFNISIVGYWERLLTTSSFTIPLLDTPALARALSIICSICVFLGCLWSGRSGSGENGIVSYSVWICAMMLLSPVNGYYNLILLLLPFLSALRIFEQTNSLWIRSWLVIGSALCCIPPGWTMFNNDIYAAFHTGWGILLLTPALYGLFIYWILLIILQRTSQERYRIP